MFKFRKVFAKSGSCGGSNRSGERTSSSNNAAKAPRSSSSVKTTKAPRSSSSGGKTITAPRTSRKSAPTGR